MPFLTGKYAFWTLLGADWLEPLRNHMTGNTTQWSSPEICNALMCHWRLPLPVTLSILCIHCSLQLLLGSSVSTMLWLSSWLLKRITWNIGIKFENYYKYPNIQFWTLLTTTLRLSMWAVEVKLRIFMASCANQDECGYHPPDYIWTS